jgi:hypothetical protein
LVDTKDIDNSETLLQCLIQIFHKKYNGKYTNFACEDFHHVAKASRIELNETTKTKNILTNSLKKVSLWLNQKRKKDIYRPSTIYPIIKIKAHMISSAKK